MNQLLFERSTGSLSPSAFARIYATRLIHGIESTPSIRFDGGEAAVVSGDDVGDLDTLTARDDSSVVAHRAGANALVVDRFEGRLLLSGGADGNISLWDLDCLKTNSELHAFKPKDRVAKGPLAHRFGITQLSFYPFDSAAFLSSSYDHTLKLYSTEALSVSASFDLNSIVYTHAISPIASHLLVACATQHPAVRLVDLRSGSSAHSLPGHNAALLSVAWSPIKEHILASGDTVGVVRIWDVRQSAGTLGLLDREDSIGITGHDGLGSGARSRLHGRAHVGAVNGLSWTDDGAYIITAGHDQRVRVWDAATGANTLASFGPTLKNSHLANLPLLTTPTALTPPEKTILFYPNEREILMFFLHDGRLIKRWRLPGVNNGAVRPEERAGNVRSRNRVMALAWRGVVDGFLSGGADGKIRVWGPEGSVDDDGEEGDGDGDYGDDDGGDGDEDAGNKRKRKGNALQDVFRELTRQKITFG